MVYKSVDFTLAPDGSGNSYSEIVGTGQSRYVALQLTNVVANPQILVEAKIDSTADFQLLYVTNLQTNTGEPLMQQSGLYGIDVRGISSIRIKVETETIEGIKLVGRFTD